MNKEFYAHTASGVNFNNGIFSIYFVGQDINDASSGKFAETDQDLQLKAAVHLPAAGFLFLVSMIKNLLDNEKLSTQLDAMVNSGLIPSGNPKGTPVPDPIEDPSGSTN